MFYVQLLFLKGAKNSIRARVRQTLSASFQNTRHWQKASRRWRWPEHNPNAGSKIGSLKKKSRDLDASSYPAFSFGPVF